MKILMNKQEKILFDTFGITEKEYQKIFKSQNGKCFICEFPPTVRRLAVDHIHVKGYAKLPTEEKKKYVRGLLCYTCNKGIGFLLECKGNAKKNLNNVVGYFMTYKMKGDI